MAHQASQWQIAAAGTSFNATTGFASTVYDSGTDLVNLETDADAGPLVQGTPYEATVRHQSDTDDWSEWAEPEAFSTLHAYELAADGGSVAITGTDAALTVGRVVTAESGSVALTGGDAALLVGWVVSAEAGALTLTGTDAALIVARQLSAGAGAVTLTGTDAVLTWSGAPLTLTGSVALAPALSGSVALAARLSGTITLEPS